MEIKPGKGIQNIILGSTEEQLIALLGEPNDILIDEDDFDQNRVFEYSNLNLRATFFSDANNRLGALKCSSPELTFNNQKIIGELSNNIMGGVFNHKFGPWSTNKYFSFVFHYNDAFNISLDEEYNKVTAVSIGVLFDDEDEYLFPQTHLQLA